MFEGLIVRTSGIADGRAKARAVAIAEQLRAELPSGIEAETDADGVVLKGRGLVRRAALEPALRSLLARLR